jgi:hypothetical protein
MLQSSATKPQHLHKSLPPQLESRLIPLPNKPNLREQLFLAQSQENPQHKAAKYGTERPDLSLNASKLATQ